LNTAVLNLNGGTLQTLGFYTTNNSPTTGINFNGGNLKAGTAGNATFIPSNFGFVRVYASGGTIDNNGMGITIVPTLTGATGNGVSSVTLSSFGTGYTAPPIVTFSGGGGSGATGYATLDPTTGTLSGIVVTCPGVGYTSAPTVTLSGGGGSGAAINTVSTAANTAGSMTFAGPAVTALSSVTNSYSGVNVVGGVLQVAADGGLGAVPASPTTNITLNNGGLYNNGGALTLSGSRNIVISGAGYLKAGWGPAVFQVGGQISGTGNLLIGWDGGVVMLSASNSYTGSTTVGSTVPPSYWNNAGATPTLRLGNANALPTNTDINYGTRPSNGPNNTATLDLYGFSPMIGGLNGVSAYDIVTNTAVTGSTLTVGGNNASGAYAGTISGTTSGTIALVKTGSGTQTLSGTNTYTGGTTVNGGVLAITSNSAIGAAAGAVTLNNGQLADNGSSLSLPVGRNISLATAGYLRTEAGMTINGQVSGGNLGIAYGSGTVILAGSNNYAGSTTIGTVGNAYNTFAAATLQLGNDNALPLGTALSFGVNPDNSGYVGTLDMNGHSPIVGALSGPGGIVQNTASGPVTLAIGSGGGSGSFAGAIQAYNGTVHLVKTGAGNQILSGANSYTGNTTVNGGTLSLAGGSTNNIPSSPVITLGSSTTLDVSGLSSGAITLGSNQTLTGVGAVKGGVITSGANSLIVPGGSTTIGTLAISGNFDLTGGATLDYRLGTPGASSAAPGQGSLISNVTNLTLPGSQIANLFLINNAGINGQGSLGSGWYDLINYTGALTGDPATAFGTGSGARTYAYSVVAGSPNKLLLDIIVNTVTWTGQTGGSGAANSNWDTSSTNWALGASPAAYIDGEIVQFNDTNAVTSLAVSNGTVTIGSQLNPTSVTFNNSSVNYLVNGSGGIAGPTGITKNGTGRVSLQTANSFTLPVAVNTGALNIGNASALGNVAVVATVSNGAALELQGGISFNANPLELNGAGLAASPAGALNNVSDANTYPGAITLGSNATIGASGGSLTITGGVTNNGNLLTVNGAGTTIVNGTAISGSGGLTKNGSGMLVLSSANTYGGATIVNGGTLQLNTYAAAIPTGANTSNVSVNGSGLLDLNGNSPTINGLSGNGTVDTAAAFSYSTLTIGNNDANSTFSGVLQNSNGSTLNLSKTGAGVAALTGNNTFIGSIAVNQGVLALSGSNNQSATTIYGGTLSVATDAALGAASVPVNFYGSGSLQFAAPLAVSAGRTIAVTGGITGVIDNAGNAVTIPGTIANDGAVNFQGAGVTNLTGNLAGTGGTAVVGGQPGNGVLEISSTASVSQYRMSLGNISGGVGAIYQTGGTVVTGLAGGNSLGIGNITGGFGYYSLASGGSLQTQETQIGSWGPDVGGNGGSGILEVSGGTLDNLGWLVMTRSGGTLAQSGVLNMSAGSLNFAGGGLVANWGATQTAIINLSGGTVATTNNTGINLNQSGNAANTGILNLNGGLALVSNITRAGTAGSMVNFNGGTLKASGANANFITVDNANVYSGGVTIDDSGYNLTVTQNLLGATGNGVTSISTTAGGTGYVSPPIINLTGGDGTGATAIATINQATGQLTSITITNSGTGYTIAPTVSLIGGGGSGASFGTVSLGANANTGGLTKTGTGVLTLSGSDTYGGTTSVSQGIILSLKRASLPSYTNDSVAPLAGLVLQIGASDEATWSDYNTLLGSSAFAPGSGIGVSVASGTSIAYAGSPVATTQANKSFLKFGAGGLVFTDTASYTGYTGYTLVSAGTLQYGNGSGPMTMPVQTFVDNGMVVFNATNNLAVTQSIAGTGGLGQAGPSVLSIAATQAYAGATAVNGGTMQLGVDQALPSTTVVTLNGGVVDMNSRANSVAQFIVNNSAMAQANGALTVTGTMDGAMQVGGIAGSVGSYTMSGGTLNVTAQPMDVGWYGTGTFNQTGGAVVNTNNYLIIGRQTTGVGTYNISGGTVTNTANYLALGQAGSGTLNVSGSGVVVAGGAGLSVASIYAGGGKGTVNLNAGGLIQTTAVTTGGGTSTFNFNGGTLQAAPAGTTTNFITGVTNAVVGTGGAVIDTNGNNLTLSQVLTGGTADGGLTKGGAGMLSVTSYNNYSGPTTVTSGTLQLGNPLVAQYNFATLAAGATTVPNTGANAAVPAGTVQAGAAIVGGGRNGNNALQLTGGSTSYVSVASGITDMSGNGNWTVAGWIQTTGSGATLFYKGNGTTWVSGNDTVYLTNGSGGGTYMGAVRWGGGWVAGNTPVNDGTWHFVAITDAGGTKTVYTDGTANTLTANAFNGADVGTQVLIGYRPVAGDGTAPFNGLIDSMSYYSSALTPAQIQAIMANTTTQVGANNVLPAASLLQVASGAVFDMNGGNQQVAGLSNYAGGGGSVTTSVPGSIVLTLSPTAGATTFSGSISNGAGVIGLVKSGLGTLTLSGTNTYSGGTTVNDGTLIVTNSEGIYDGTNLSVGSSSLLSLLPEAVVPAGTVASPAAAGASEIAPVPEPSTLVLLLAGAAAAVAVARRKRT
jgi:fibronectin-binding autotransporter adhesin